MNARHLLYYHEVRITNAAKIWEEQLKPLQEKHNYDRESIYIEAKGILEGYMKEFDAAVKSMLISNT